MHDLDQAERAQLGLQYIEDAVVNLLTNHPEGLTPGTIADALGLSNDLASERRETIAAGVVELLLRSGRILWDPAANKYLDNPEKL
jgi:hypothetical protein